MLDDILERELGKVGQKGGALGGFLGAGLLGSIGSTVGGVIGGAIGGKLGATWAASKLPIDEVHEEVILEQNLTSSIMEVLNSLDSMGTIIDSSNYTEYPVISAVCGSGFGKMNPAVICVEFVEISKSKTNLYISAYAKEGVIKQKTAIKAIKRFKYLIN